MIDRAGVLSPVSATVDSAALRCVIACAHAAGVDVATMLRRHGMELAHFEPDAPSRALALPVVVAFVRELIDGAQPGWPLRGARRVPPGAMGVLDHLCQAAPTVGACLADFGRYFALVAHRGRVTIEDTAISIAFEVEAEPLERIFVEASVGLLWSRLRAYVGRAELSPERVDVRWTLDDAARRDWHDVVGGRVAGDRPGNRIEVSPQLVAEPLAGDNAALRSFLDRLAAQALPSVAETWADRVARQLVTGHSDAELPAVAKRLAVSERTLRRRLGEEGTSFSEIRQRELRRRAEALLREGRLSPAEIAFCLGFSEISAFNRAFRRWTGRSPGAWRQAGRSS